MEISFKCLTERERWKTRERCSGGAEKPRRSRMNGKKMPNEEMRGANNNRVKFLAVFMIKWINTE